MNGTTVHESLHALIARFCTDPAWENKLPGSLELRLDHGQQGVYLFQGGPSPSVEKDAGGGDSKWELSSSTFEHLCHHKISPQEAFHLGELRIQGNVAVSLLFCELFV